GGWERGCVEGGGGWRASVPSIMCSAPDIPLRRLRMRARMVRATVLLVAAVLGVTAMADSPAVSFHKDVEPILQKNCQTCHRPGQVAPMSFLTYENVRPWARAM